MDTKSYVDADEDKKYHRKLFYVFIFISIFLFGGAIFYHYVEKWSYLDALYFATLTMTSVGYGDITPKTDSGKIFLFIVITFIW